MRVLSNLKRASTILAVLHNSLPTPAVFCGGFGGGQGVFSYDKITEGAGIFLDSAGAFKPARYSRYPLSTVKDQ